MLHIPNEASAVTRRFFEALDVLKQRNEITSVVSFAERYKINVSNMYTLRKEPERRIIKPEYLVYLSRDYKISSEWLLLGTGKMFK